jgi:hypothetical protein
MLAESFIGVPSQPDCSPLASSPSTSKGDDDATSGRDFTSENGASDERPTTGRIVGRSKWPGMNQLQNEINHLVRRSFMFHYQILGVWETVFAAGRCCNLLQTVSDAG